MRGSGSSQIYTRATRPVQICRRLRQNQRGTLGSTSKTETNQKLHNYLAPSQNIEKLKISTCPEKGRRIKTCTWATRAVMNEPLDMRLKSLALEQAKKMQKDIIKAKHHLTILKTTRSSEVKCMDSSSSCSYNLCHKLKAEKSSSKFQNPRLFWVGRGS